MMSYLFMMFPAFLKVSLTGCAVIFVSGYCSFSLSEAKVAFSFPKSFMPYNICLCRLDSSTLSKSTTPNFPIPEAARYWRTGHPVVYYNNGNTSVTNLESATGDFTDNPSGPSTGKYWVIRTTGTDNRTFKLASSEQNALAGTALTSVPTGTPTGNHVLFDYDYYANRKYWIDGFSSKGLSRLILQPTQCNSGGGGETNVIVPAEVEIV